jgi:hypothetical protein
MLPPINHIKKLDILASYISKRIDSPSERYVSFDVFLETRYPQFIQGSPYYYRDLSTHCYYCDKRFNKDYYATVDHFFPQSKNGGRSIYKDVFVICCNHCNVAKGCRTPEWFIDMITRANIKGRSLNGFDSKDLGVICNNVNKISNEARLGVGKNIYFKRKGKK